MKENIQKAYKYNSSEESNQPTDVPTSIGLALFPPYPKNVWTTEYLKSSIGREDFYYQNGGDWTWFGALIAIGLINYGLIEEANSEIKKMSQRVLNSRDVTFYEWWYPKGVPIDSKNFRASAGGLYSAIKVLKKWAEGNK